MTIKVTNKTFDSSDKNNKDETKFYTLQGSPENPKVREIVELKKPRPMTQTGSPPSKRCIHGFRMETEATEYVPKKVANFEFP